jgi:glycosyltransferase involved in cell wall biosynthesis
MADLARGTERPSSNAKARIAWVTFDFPPRQSSGVFRAIKIYKYLDKSRFEVDFITHGTARRFARAVNDDSLLAEVSPAPAIHRVATLIPHDLLPAIRTRLRGRRASASADGPATASAGETPATDRAPRQVGLGGRLYRWLALALYFPDHLFVWGWAAAFRALWLHARRRYDLVYTTSHPESAHLAGLMLSAVGVPWVVDYRYGGPLWIKQVVGFPKSSLRERLDHRYQRWVLRRADHVITQSERIRADFCRVFGLDPARVQVLSSGYDEADFAGASVGSAEPFTKRDHEIHLLHVGAFEGLAEAQRLQLVRALNDLGRALRDRGHALVFHAVGSDLFRDAERRELSAVDYRRHGVIVHRHLPAYLRAADCCLLSTWTTTNGDVKGFIPSKLWEYLRAGLPILTTGPKDEVWSIVETAGVGVFLPIDSFDSARLDALAEELLSRVRTKKPLDSNVSRYSWESRAQSLQAVFLRMIDGPRIASC